MFLNRKTSSSQGFSLIELSIALVIIGLLFVPLAKLWEVRDRHEKESGTEGNMGTIDLAIRLFVDQNGHYPRPASLSVPENDPSHGQESVGVPLPCDPDPAAAWRVQGWCVTAGNDVFIGAVPFSALALEKSVALDSWHNRILYAVTAQQTDDTTYSNDPTAGGIQIDAFRLDPPPPAPPPHDVVTQRRSNTYDMIMISHGRTARGAYSRNGTLVSPCDMGAWDSENCNMDNLFFFNKGDIFGTPFTMAPSAASRVDGATFYDDLTHARDNVAHDVWVQSLVEAENAISRAQRLAIGLGTDTADTPEAGIHVFGGNVRVEQDPLLPLTGRVRTKAGICREPGNCFAPRLIAGSNAAGTEMRCPIGKPVVRIGNGEVTCASETNQALQPLLPTQGQAFRLPVPMFSVTNCATEGKLVRGIKPDGSVQCDLP